MSKPQRTKTVIVFGRPVVCVEWLCKRCGRLIGWNHQKEGVTITQCWHNRCKADNALVDGVPCLVDEVMSTPL